MGYIEIIHMHLIQLWLISFPGFLMNNTRRTPLYKYNILSLLLIGLLGLYGLSGCQPSSNDKAQTADCAFADVDFADLTANRPTDDDYWVVTAPEDQGMNGKILAQGLPMLEETPGLYSLLVIRHGKIVFEEYFNGAGVDKSSNIFSISKSFMSALTGIAIREGYLEDTAQPIAEVLPAYFEDGQNQDKTGITLEHMLTMTQGLPWNDDWLTGQIRNSRDWVDFILARAKKDEPGDAFIYSTGMTHVMSAAISETSGMHTCAFAQENLFEPLDISIDYWLKDPKGIYSGGWHMFFTPRELAKFGQLYLQNGEWQGKQVVPADWVAQSLDAHVYAGSIWDYGYWWWVTEISGYKMASARGAGNQMIHLIPELDLILVTTSNFHSGVSNSALDSYYYLGRYVIPAITDQG
jgi:CubicO group peptidase (beta-lactamase class C family)